MSDSPLGTRRAAKRNAQNNVTQHGCLTMTKAVGLRESNEHCYASRYSPDGNWIATTWGNGVLRVLDAKTLETAARVKLSSDDTPATGVKWRPLETNFSESQEAEPGVYELAVASTAGVCFGYALDATQSSPYLDKLWKCPEDKNETGCLDYSPDGKWLCTAGSDHVVRLYDPKDRRCVQILSQGTDNEGHVRPAHTNRIFSLAWCNEQFFLSGGWECPVQLWDIRSGKSERQFSGPTVSADSIEPMWGSQRVIIGSGRNTKQISVFDFMTGREIVEEGAKYSKAIGTSVLSQVRFSPHKNIIWGMAQKPDALLCIDARTGALKGAVKEGLPNILSLDVDKGEGSMTVGRCVAVGFNESVFTVDCK